MAQERKLLRPRLLRMARSALEQGHLFLVAPGGYGKTLFLRSLVTQRPNSYYFALTQADADLTYLQARLTTALPQPTATIVLDDIHHLAHANESLRWLATQLSSPQPRFILSGREQVVPNRDLAVTVLTAADLAFTPTETEALTSHSRWFELTHGWPLALALLLQLSNGGDETLPGQSEEMLFDHLIQALLAELPATLVEFMRATAIPLRFNPALATHLFGIEADGWLDETRSRQLFLEEVELEKVGNEEASNEGGWLRYHDLVRHFFIQSMDARQRQERFEATVTWFRQTGDVEMAVEHALAGELYEEAVQLLLDMPVRFLRDLNRYLTYRHWIRALPGPLIAQHPDLLVRLATHLFTLPGYRQEAWQLMQQADIHAQAIQKSDVSRQARNRLAMFHYRSGNYAEALQMLEVLLADVEHTSADHRDAERLYSLRLSAITLAETARFREAKRHFNEVLAAAVAAGDIEEEIFNRQNLAITVLAPLGEYGAAEQHMAASLAHYQDTPGLRIRCLHMLCDLLVFRGDWDALDHTLNEIEELKKAIEVTEVGEALWPPFYYACVAAGQHRIADARREADLFRSRIAGENQMALISAAWLDCWLLRREGRYHEAMQVADAILSQPLDLHYWRTAIALQRDIARAELDTQLDALATEPFALHVEISNLITWRARAELVLLRALLAYLCWRHHDPRWRRHARSLLRSLQHPGYEQLLTQREPDLGGLFWAMLVAEGLETPRALAELQQTGTIRPLYNFLRNNESAVRMRAAQALATIGDEAAIPYLQQQLEQERDAAARSALDQALIQIENRPAPPLDVQLMGELRVRHSGEALAEEAWPRPIVKKLFCYFVFHRGQPLPKERILDDLWPDSDPLTGAATFRRVHSWLRGVLEPYLRAKAHSRYFLVEGDVYTFDPGDRVDVDVERFTHSVRRVLNARDHHDIPPLDPAFLTLLEQWQPLLPMLPYAEWLIEPRERLHTLYVEGCLYAANAFFIRQHLDNAIAWAERTVTQAPWLEEAYQILMRAHARRDERSLALKAYVRAEEALTRELAADPSPLTQWLAARLRRGEEI